LNRIVVDTSICLKWFINRGRKPDRLAALELLAQVDARKFHLVQPQTWRAHVTAMLVQKDPSVVKKGIDTLLAMKPRDGETRQTLHLASELALTLHADLFATLYHAIAIEKGIELVTADAAYHARAAHLGHIRMLRDWVARSRIAERNKNYLRRHSSKAAVRPKKR
jgi:predicted nucleic acid-binding protein